MCHCGFRPCQRDTSASICAGVICEDQQKDRSAFVTTGRIVPRHDKEILPKANAAYGCIWNVLLDKHAIPQVCEGGRVSHGNYSKQHVTNGAFQLPAGCLKWLCVEPRHFSDIRGISAQRHMSGAGMMGCWTSQTMQNVAVCFDQGLQNRCCNLCSGGSCFKCAKPMWLDSVVESQWAPFWKCQLLLSQATTELLLKWSPVKPGSTVSPLVFGGEMEVAACFFPESKQNEGPSATRQRRYALQGVQNESKI